MEMGCPRPGPVLFWSMHHPLDRRPHTTMVEPFTLEPGGSIHGHSHGRLHLCCLADGEFRDGTGGAWRECGAGTVRVSPAGEPHHIELGSERALGQIVELPSPVVAGLVRPLGASVFLSSETFPMVGQLFDALRNRDPFQIEARSLELVSRAALTKGRDVVPPAWLAALRLEVDELAGSGHSLERVASRALRHRSHVARSFREQYGRTIGAHVRARRLHTAADLLRATEVPIVEIAGELGFTDQAHFTRLFRAYFGVTPGRFRRHATHVQD